ncbi:hypothetical protein BpHYR1_042713 [Brachionus plicatilis]|uniref:Uncharacterized protein n=1 Tax=Brachionus plicatilis TaxID=10195 RepID=A0A3M7PUJ3_BRAPC|nr:hypothetical protein BpHYR1_042713 [Brachionus plicatilis]
MKITPTDQLKVGRPRKGSRLPSSGNPEPVREPASEANSQIGSTKDYSTPKVGEQYSFIQQPAINLTKVFAGKENEDLEQWLEGFQAQTYRSLLEGRAKNLIRKLPLGKTDTCEKVIKELRNVFGNLRSKDPREELDKLRKDPNESYQYFGIRVVELIQIVYEGINGLCANMLNLRQRRLQSQHDRNPAVQLGHGPAAPDRHTPIHQAVQAAQPTQLNDHDDQQKELVFVQAVQCEHV